MNYSDETAEEGARLQDEIDSQNLWDLDSKVDQAMDALRCPPDDWAVTNLSGGEKRRVALCKLLLEQPELLLLDEPTNHLDAETVNWLENHLREYPGAILIVTHDRYFLDNVTGWILELDRGKGIPYEGNYSSWLQQKQKRLEQEGREDAARQRTMAREQEWVASSPRAGRRRTRRASPATRSWCRRLRRRPGHRADHHSHRRAPRRQCHRFREPLQGFPGQAADREPLFKLPPGGIVGVIGPNGAGKTTLFR